VARITRKELKTDKFALEVEHSLTFFEEHQKELLRYVGLAIALVVVYFAVSTYRRHQQTARESALSRAIVIQETAVGTVSQNGSPSFPTQGVKDEAAIKAFTDLKNKYSGSDEAEIGQYYLGSIYADQGKFSDAEKALDEVSQKGSARYASLAKLSLAQVYFAEGKTDQARKVLDDLKAHPTLFVSADQADMALARGIMSSNPAEARKLLDSLRNKPGQVGQVALSLYGQLPAQ